MKKVLGLIKSLRVRDIILIILCIVSYLVLIGTIYYMASRLCDFIEFFLVAALIILTAIATWFTTLFFRNVLIFENIEDAKNEQDNP